MSASVRKPSLDKRSFLRILIGVYLFLLFLICFSLSVPPADLPLCGLLLVLAVLGIILARRERRAWRLFWTGALILALLFAVLEVIGGWRIARQRSDHALMRKKSLQPTPVGAFSSAFAVDIIGLRGPV